MQTTGYVGLGYEQWCGKEHKVAFQCDGNILYVDCGGGYISVCIHLSILSKIFYFKFRHSIEYKLYLNKVGFKKLW